MSSAAVNYIDQLIGMSDQVMDGGSVSVSDVNKLHKDINSIADNAFGVSPATQALDAAMQGNTERLEQQLHADHNATSFFGNPPVREKVSNSKQAQSASVMQSRKQDGEDDTYTFNN